MPFLSRARKTKYPVNAAFTPVTVLNRQDAPQYGLFFDVKDTHQGTDFAFDNCADLAQLQSDKVDVNFLISRYERLFRYGGTDFFYLVPWMGIRYRKAPSGTYEFDDPIFALKVTRHPPYPIPLPLYTPPTVADLKLDVSHPSIKAVWAARESEPQDRDTLPAVDLGTFTSENILLFVDDAADYKSRGEHIDIRDVTHGKTVGRLRIVFLKKIVQKIFLFKLTELPPSGSNFYSLERLPRPGVPDGIPESLETPHKKILSDANVFGLNQIGVSLELEEDDVDLYAKDGTAIMGVFGNRQPHLFADAGDLSEEAQYRAWLQSFIDTKVAYVKSATGAKESKYRWLYIFITPFTFSTHEFYKTTLGYSIQSIKPRAGSPTKATADFSSGLPPNVSLFRTIQNENGGLNFAERFHFYRTLVHEAAHACMVSHYFNTDRPPIPLKQYAVLYNEVYEAHRCLRLFLDPPQVALIKEEMSQVFDFYRVRIDELKMSQAGKPMWTLFDEMIEFDVDTAVTTFITTKMFSGQALPGYWKLAANTGMPMADLTIWMSLNDLVKFKQFKTSNVMDYSQRRVMVNISTNEAWVARKIVRWTRLQWELIRKTVDHYDHLKTTL